MKKKPKTLPKKLTLFVVVVPWDYSSATCEAFATRGEARDYILNEVRKDLQSYAFIQEFVITPN